MELFALFLTAVFDPSEIIPSVYSRCYGRVGEMEELFHRRFRDGLTQEVVLVHLRVFLVIVFCHCW